MVVTREPGEVYLLGHETGDRAAAWVEAIDPVSLAVVHRSIELAGGPTWPGGVAAHANGSLYVVFGRHLHRLRADLSVVASRSLARNRPYNSFVVLPGGEIVTKDFGGARPGDDVSWLADDCEVTVLDPATLATVATLRLPEASVARVSADGDDVVVVGVTTVFFLHWDGRRLVRNRDLETVYRTEAGQGYGWDAVVTPEDVWFLDNGAGSERYDGSLRGQGVASTPELLWRIARRDGGRRAYEVNDERGGLVANPPAVDLDAGIVVGYDSGNGVVSGFGLDDSSGSPRWRRRLNHAMHPVVVSGGRVVLNDFDPERQLDDLVVLDVYTGEELGRVTTPSPVQSVLFAAMGFDNDLYACSFSHVIRVTL